MLNDVTYIEAEVTRLRTIDSNSFSTMVHTILKDQSLEEEIFIIKDNKVYSGKLYKNMCYGVIDNKTQELISKAESDGFKLHSIMPNIQRNYFVAEYYDTEYKVFVGPTVRSATTLKLVLLYEKRSEPGTGEAGDVPTEETVNKDEYKLICKPKHDLPF